ncbi:MAG: hypothetical protein ACRCS3_03915 [Paracoccaceae bacterium]
MLQYRTLCRGKKTFIPHIPYQFSAGTLQLLIDSTGVKGSGDHESLPGLQ